MTKVLCLIKSILLVTPLLLSIGCQKNSSTPQLSVIDSAQVIQAIEAAVWAFYDADTSRNADKVISLLWPDCTMLIDGHRIHYKDISSGSREFMSGVAQFHSEWRDLEIVLVSENAAISSFVFKDSIIDKSGNLTYSEGPNTFLWQKRNGEWRVLYGDADHYQLK